MSNLIGIDGPDGSGKTTVARELAHITGSRYMYFSDNNILTALRHEADQLSYEERFAFYLSMNILNHPKLETIRNSESQAVIIDRTPLSTFAYHEVMGVNLKPYYPIRDHLLKQFDGLCYLFADSKTRMARITTRAKESSISKFDQFSLKFEDEIHKAFLSILPEETLIIDTSELNIEQAAQSVQYGLQNQNCFKYE